jgi:hypothetical protein
MKASPSLTTNPRANKTAVLNPRFNFVEFFERKTQQLFWLSSPRYTYKDSRIHQPPLPGGTVEMRDGYDIRDE